MVVLFVWRKRKKERKEDVLGSQGVAQVEILLSNHFYSWPVYIADTGEDFILGADFLDEQDITVQIRQGLLHHSDWTLECVLERKNDGLSQIRLMTPWTIPAQHEAICPVPIPILAVKDKSEQLFEPSNHSPGEGIIFGRILVTRASPTLPLRGINTSTEDITIPAGIVLGELQVVTEVLSGPCEPPPEYPQTSKIQDVLAGDLEHLRNSSSEGVDEDLVVDLRHIQAQDPEIPDPLEPVPNAKQPEEDSALPEHLIGMYDKCCETIQDLQVRKGLRDFLITHQETFATDKNDLYRSLYSSKAQN